jgi:hypothetical protein
MYWELLSILLKSMLLHRVLIELLKSGKIVKVSKSWVIIIIMYLKSGIMNMKYNRTMNNMDSSLIAIMKIKIWIII